MILYGKKYIVKNSFKISHINLIAIFIFHKFSPFIRLHIYSIFHLIIFNQNNSLELHNH